MSNPALQAVVIQVVDRFDALDRAISVNDDPACTLCRELCHAVDYLWARYAPDHPRYDESGYRRDPLCVLMHHLGGES